VSKTRLIRGRHGTLLAAMAGLACIGAFPALAQPQDAPPPAEPPREAPLPADGPGIEERLQRRLDELSAERERLLAAMELARKGADREEVMRALRPPGAEGDAPRQERDGRPWDRRPDRMDGDRPGREGPGRDRDGERPSFRDPEHRERVMAYLREHLPEVADRLDEMNESNPQLAERITSRLGPRVGEIMDLQEREPELASLKLEELRNGLAIIEAIRQCREAGDSPEQLAPARATLSARIADQFDIRARLNANEIERLRRRLDRLQADLDSQLSEREQTIQQRTDDFLSGREKVDLFGEGRGPGRQGPDGSTKPPRPADGPPPR
jgi:hypothetical protein